jgi:molybdenum cofactor cytidylyltransferase
VVHEPAFADGLATTLRRGLLAVRPDTRAVVVGLGDQPFVRPDAYRRVVALWMSTGADIVVPRYSDTDVVSHPVLFARNVFDELSALRGDVGARDVIARDPERVARAMIDWEAPADVDTRDDLARITTSPLRP